MPQNGHLRTARQPILQLPWRSRGPSRPPAVGQRRRLRATGADVAAEQVQQPQRSVRLQHFCQSLPPPRNGTMWKRWRREDPRCIEGGGCGVPTPHFQWIPVLISFYSFWSSWVWCDSFEMFRKNTFKLAWMPLSKLIFIKPQWDSQFKGFNQTGGERLLVAWLPPKLNQ